MPLVTQNVFIDTEFFVKANLDFKSKTIESFEELCSDNEFNYITTTVVIQEVKNKIIERVKEATKEIKNFKRKAAVLKGYNDETIKILFKEINEKDLEEKALTSFDNFIDASNATVVNMSAVDGDEIMDMFFAKKAPFSDKKPNEFRDAFSLLALQSKLNEKEKIYIVSSDQDLKAFCVENDNFINVDTLDALLDIYNKHKDERSEFVEKFLLSKNEDIKNMIKEELEKVEAYNSSDWENVEIDSFDVIDVSDFTPQIIHIDDKSCQIKFDVDVKFLVNATGPDYKNGIYNKEEGTIYAFDNVERQEEETHQFSVELDLFFEANVDKFIADDFELYIPNTSDIEFSVEEEPQHLYY